VSATASRHPCVYTGYSKMSTAELYVEKNRKLMEHVAVDTR
jgi:hypothetical protein